MRSRPIYKEHVPFVRFSGALIPGILTANLFGPSFFTFYFVYCTVISLSILWLTVALISRFKQHVYFGYFGMLWFLILYFFGIVTVWRKDPQVNAAHFSHFPGSYLIGTVASEPQQKNHLSRMKIRIRQVVNVEGLTRTCNGWLLLTIETAAERPQYGQLLMLKAKYKANPEPLNPNEFNYGQYLSKHGMWHQSYLKGAQVRILSDEGGGNKLVGYALQLRRRMLKKMELYITKQDENAVASSLVLGYRADLSKEMMNAFSTTGTIHVLAVSGMHVGIIFIVVSFSLSWMKKNSILASLRCLLLVTTVWAYAILTGLSVSILRAALMLSFVIVSTSFNQRRNVYNSLAASAFILLLYEPQYLLEIGFQMSYLAVIAIIWLMPKLEAIYKGSNKFIKWVLGYVMLSVAAQLATFPLAMYYFHFFPVYFLPANLFIVFPVTIMIYGGFVLLLFLPHGALAATYGMYMQEMMSFLLKGLEWISALPMAKIDAIWIDPYHCMMIYFTIICLCLAFIYRNKLCLKLALMASVFLASCYSYAQFSRLTQQRIIVYQMQRDMAIAVLNGNRALIVSNLTNKHASKMQYAVQPAIQRYAHKNKINWINERQRYRSEAVVYEEKCIRVAGKSFVIYDDVKQNIPEEKIDWLLIRNGAVADLATFLALKQVDLLLVDASNSAAKSAQYRAIAAQQRISLYELNDNFAYVWEGN